MPTYIFNLSNPEYSEEEIESINKLKSTQQKELWLTKGKINFLFEKILIVFF
jgi:hypothetical protein